MFGQLSPEKGTKNLICNERGNTTRTLLLLLLLVVAAAGYLYYFTDLIRPKEAAKPAPVQTAQVKKPLPPRPAPQAGEGAAPVKPEEAKPKGGAPAAPAAAKPSVEKKPAPAAASPAKPEPPKVAKAQPPVKPVTAPAPAAKPAPASAKSAPAPVKKQVASVSAAKKEAAPAKRTAKGAKTAAKRKGGGYALLLGDFVPDPTFLAVQTKLKKSGITPVRKSVLTAPEPMNRLFVAQFTDQDTAEAELQKLKRLTADAFLVADNGTYTLYAGSYFTEIRTASEMKRLNARGVTPVIRKTRLAIKVTRVTAGSYASKEEARKDALRLKKQGVRATVIKTGK